jgi:hypothetical protein
LIHPVAGRCKHCKEDLSQFRSSRAAAAAPLPALRGNGHPNGAKAASAVPAGVPVAIAAAESQPILPPRPTGRSVAAQAPSMWRSWPVLVIILAILAIGAAVTLMVWPTGQSDSGKRALQPPPAPEHMETNPLPPSQPQGGGGADPWSPPHSQVDPRPTPDPVPNPPDEPDDPDRDPFGGGGVVGGTLGGASFLYTELDHACRKLKTCPDVDQSMLSMTCDLVSSMPKRPVPSCAAAQRCLDAIDHMSCSQTGFANPTSVITMFQDCTTATTRC